MSRRDIGLGLARGCGLGLARKKNDVIVDLLLHTECTAHGAKRQRQPPVRGSIRSNFCHFSKKEGKKDREFLIVVDTCSRRSVHFSLSFIVYLSKAGLVDPAERPLSPPYDELPASSSLNQWFRKK